MHLDKWKHPETRRVILASRWVYEGSGAPNRAYTDGWVLTKDEYNALPDGFRVIDRTGDQHIKKGPTTGIGSNLFERELSLYCAMSEFEYLMVLAIANEGE